MGTKELDDFLGLLSGRVGRFNLSLAVDGGELFLFGVAGMDGDQLGVFLFPTQADSDLLSHLPKDQFNIALAVVVTGKDLRIS